MVSFTLNWSQYHGISKYSLWYDYSMFYAADPNESLKGAILQWSIICHINPDIDC